MLKNKKKCKLTKLYLNILSEVIVVNISKMPASVAEWSNASHVSWTDWEDVACAGSFPVPPSSHPLGRMFTSASENRRS